MNKEAEYYIMTTSTLTHRKTYKLYAIVCKVNVAAAQTVKLNPPQLSLLPSIKREMINSIAVLQKISGSQTGHTRKGGDPQQRIHFQKWSSPSF